MSSGANRQAAPPRLLAAAAGRIDTGMGEPSAIDLIADPQAARSGALVVSGFSQPDHGWVTVIGPRAIYTPTPGYSGPDSFRYTVSDSTGSTATSMVAIGVAEAAPTCTITISGPPSAIQGPAIHLTAVASCTSGTPEIQWQHRTGTSGTFVTFKNFSSALFADFATTTAALGAHQFRARVRSTANPFTTFLSNTVTTTLIASTSPCTAVTIDAPPAGAVVATGQAITLSGTATCPAGVVPEYQYWVKQAGAPDYTVLPGYFPGSTSYTPATAGSWQFVVAARAVGSSDPFQAQSAAVTVLVSHAPVAVDDTLAVDEDHTGTVNVVANDSDPDGDALTASISTAPAAGTASISAGVISYHPATNYNGNDTIGYTVSDGHGNTATAVVHVAVNPVQDPPSAHHDFLTLAEDTTALIDVTANDTDVDGDALAVTAHTSPSHGSAVFTGTVLTYTPATNYHGDDYLEYTISDGHGGMSTASVFITVTTGNDTPSAHDDQITTAEDTAGGVDLLANDSDPDNDPLTVVSFTQPAHGAVTVTAGAALYTPVANYNGPDEFSYTVQDPGAQSSSAVVHITVVAVNDPPSAAPDSASLDEDGEVTIDAVGNDSDIDLDPLTISAVTQPAHGTAAIVSGHEVSYTPAADYHGNDSFTYTITDGTTTATATVSLSIASINDPPIAAADTVATDEDAAASFAVTANDSDVDLDPLTITAVTQPLHGTAAIVDATHVSYTPVANYNGPDAFSYTISDGHGGEAGASISVTVNPVNDAPSAAPDSAATDEDTAVAIDAVGNDSDIDLDALGVASVTQPAHGTAAIVDATHVSYTPAANYHGPDAFSYTVSDGHGGEASAAITVTVAPVNDAPTAAPDTATLAEDSSAVIDVIANDSDIDGPGDPLAVASVTQPAHGAVAIVDGHHVAYTPVANYHGPDVFTYTVTDLAGATDTALVAIDVTSVNDAPIAVADAAGLDEDSAVTVDVVANDTDVDLDALTITAITQPAHGLAILLDDHRVRYIPAPDYNGADAVGYTISDGNGGAASAVLSLDVAAVNDAPVAVGDAATLDEDTSVTIDVVANDSDVDNDSLAVASVTQPAHGAVAITGLHAVRYTPAANFNGADSFSYSLDDGHGGSATATVAITVNPVNDAPAAAPDTALVTEDVPATLTVTANDSDLDGDTIAVISVTAPAHGSATVVDAGHVGYTPALDYHGPDSFSYTISDGHGGEATASVAVTVTPVNDAPVATAGSLNTYDDTSATATLAAIDVDLDPLSFAITTGPSHGTLGAVVGNHVVYTPAAGYAGPDVIAFTAFDGQATSAPALVSINVVRSTCGNGVREGVHEECDDGNAVAGDGCESTCKLSCGSGTGADRATVDPASGHCFAAYDGVQHSYQQAAAMCSAFGGHLPTLASAGEDAAAFSAVHVSDAPWLGIDDVAIEGSFGWITGEAVGYTNFGPTQPSAAGGADCVRYAADGTWSAVACSGSNGSSGTLCEYELAVATPAFAAGGAGTRGVAIGDLNGDGYADLVAVNGTANTAGVLLGNGAGGFSLAGTYATGTGPIAVAAGDFDGDGDLDLAVVNQTASTLGVLRNTGGGAYVAGATVNIGGSASSVAVADVDQDGLLDLVVGSSNAVQVLKGNGSGGFTAQPSILVLGLVAAVAVGDFNKDGAIDLALTTPLAVVVLLGTGGGGFAPSVSVAVSTGNRAVVVADLDGDGNLDLAIANGNTAVSVFFGSALGVFGNVVNLDIGALPLLVAAGDFDGDGGGDVIAVTAGYAMLYHGSARTFTKVAAVATGGGGASGAAFGDVNGDGAPDLVIANSASANVGVMLGGAGLAGTRALPAGTGATGTVSGDFNEDGKLDLAVIDPGSSKIYVYLQNTAGVLVLAFSPATGSGAGASYGVAADFDGDGHLDILVPNSAASTVSVLLGTGTGSFGAPQNTSCGPAPRRPAIGDFNGDGKLDVAVPLANSNVVSILINTGLGRFGRVNDVTLAAGSQPAAVVAGDFNGDGKKDIAIATAAEASVKLAIGRNDTTFQAVTAFAVAAGGQSIAAGDLDGDGKLDVVVTNTSTSSVSLLRGTGTGSFQTATSLTVGSQPSAVVAADLDGDGKLDIIAGNGGGSITVLHNAGGASFGAWTFPVGGSPSWLTVGDFDKDGHPDIATAATTTFGAVLYSGR